MRFRGHFLRRPLRYRLGGSEISMVYFLTIGTHPLADTQIRKSAWAGRFAAATAVARTAVFDDILGAFGGICRFIFESSGKKADRMVVIFSVLRPFSFSFAGGLAFSAPLAYAHRVKLIQQRVGCAMIKIQPRVRHVLVHSADSFSRPRQSARKIYGALPNAPSSRFIETNPGCLRATVDRLCARAGLSVSRILNHCSRAVETDF